jgi:hypothetical protein
MPPLCAKESVAMRPVLTGLLLAAVLVLPRLARADEFERYTNRVLAKVPQARTAEKVDKVTAGLLAEHAGILKNIPGALLAVKTNEGRWSLLLVQPAGQKVGDDKTVPVLQIERFVTFKEGTDQAIHVQGQNIRLFDGFVFNLDIGQVVPEAVGGDLRFVSKDGQRQVEPLGKAECYLLTEPLPEAAAPKNAKLEIGSKFEPRYFNGTYKLHEDGRRSGTLHLQVEKNGDVTGHYYSDKDGRKYEVDGKIGDPNYSIDFRIVYPRTIQQFRGWLFTGDGRALAGTARMEQRETGFYALRTAE